MNQRPKLRWLILSLLDDYCVDELIKNQNIWRRFYNHETVFLMEGDNVKVDQLKFKKNLEDDGYYDPLKFSELSESHKLLGEYQLEKGSVIWKMKIKDINKQKAIFEEDNLNKLITRFEVFVYDLRYS